MMNLPHRKLCDSRWWARRVARELPREVPAAALGERVLELGPGFGATTRVLAELVPALTALEIDEPSARRLRAELGDRAAVVHGDGTRLPFGDGEFTGAVAATMLHHVPSTAAQDELFAQVHRVLEPAGTFAGFDSLPSLGFRLLHIGDTMVTLDPATLGDRLRRAGFVDVRVAHEPRKRVRFAARKPR